MNELVRMLTRSVINAAVWKAMRGRGKLATVGIVGAVSALFLVVGR